MNIVHVYLLGHQWVLGLLLLLWLLWMMLLDMGVWTPGVPAFLRGSQEWFAGPRGGSVPGLHYSCSHHQGTVSSCPQGTCFLLFDRSLPSECEVVSHCISPMALGVECIHKCLLPTWVSSWLKCLFRFSAHLKNHIIWHFVTELYELFTYSCISVPYGIK